MRRLHRAQVLLDPEQYRHLRHLAHRRALQQGRRVSISQLIRELLGRALAEEQAREEEGRAALETLLGIGVAVQARHPRLLREEWLFRDREEHDDARFPDLSTGR